jgi:GNAT superfamily N-acetyltransferase
MGKFFYTKELKTIEVIVDLSKVEKSYCNGGIQVTHKAPKALKRAMLAMAQNMRTETGLFNVTPYSEALDEGADCVGYLIFAEEQDDWDEKRTHVLIVGGACLRLKDYRDSKVWVMQWAWLFPRYRGQGFGKNYDSRESEQDLFAETWDMIEKHHPDFIVEPPYSSAMKAFLNKSPERQKRCPDHRWLR